MKKNIFLLIFIQILNIRLFAQVTTCFYGKDKIDSKNWTAALYSVEIDCPYTLVTIELIPKKNLKRMTYWTSRNTVIVIKDRIIELPIDGFATKLENGLIGIRSQPFSGDWGWTNVKKGEKYYYTLHFDGCIPPGVTNFTMIDRGNAYGEHGYQFWNYQLNNPPIGGTSFNEASIKNNIIQNIDGICGIYESVKSGGYKLGCINDSGTYKLLFLDGDKNLDWWRIGDLKATLRPTATPGIYKADWYMGMKDLRDDVIITFDGSCMRVSIDDEITDYLKMFPTADMPNETDSWSGTGFALNDKYVVTNYHVIEKAKNIKLHGIQGNFNKSYNAKIVATDKFNDLAILKITDYDFKGFGAIPYNVKTTLTDVGEEIFVLGYPLTNTMGNEIKLTTGVVSSRSGFQGDMSQYQISAPVQPGNSGGPLFDGKGNIIGIVSAKHKEAENVGYAIKTSYLHNLIESSDLSNILPKNNEISSFKLSGKVKAVKDYVYYITCSSEENSPSVNSSPYWEDDSFYKTYNNPPTNNNMAGHNLNVVSVSVQKNQTILTFSVNNRTKDGYYEWVTLDRSSYIMANGQKFTLQRADGIAISPNKTYFSYSDETITFKLFFPAIPKNSSTIDFVESLDSGWKIYGIQLW